MHKPVMNKQPHYSDDRVRAKKHLGQHFLNDLQIARNIVDALPAGEIKSVVEIGPGMGVLTQFLLEKKIDLHVVELDRESVAYIENKFPELKTKIVSGDFLRLDLSQPFPVPFSLIGNFPYNISSQILFKVLDFKQHIPFVVGMFQYEVAKRIASGHGNKDYGILSVLMQTFYDVEYLFTVNENVFTPPPKVKSGVIKLSRKENVQLPFSEKHFYDVVKTAFNQRRKMLRNGLSKFSSHPNFQQLPFLEKRVEQLSVSDFIKMSEMLS